VNPLTASRVVSRRLRDSAPGYFERAFALVVLFLSTGGLMEILRTKRGIALDDQREGDPFIQIIWLVVYGITLLLLVRRARAVARPPSCGRSLRTSLCAERWGFSAQRRSVSISARAIRRTSCCA